MQSARVRATSRQDRKERGCPVQIRIPMEGKIRPTSGTHLTFSWQFVEKSCPGWYTEVIEIQQGGIICHESDRQARQWLATTCTTILEGTVKRFCVLSCISCCSEYGLDIGSLPQILMTLKNRKTAQISPTDGGFYPNLRAHRSKIFLEGFVITALLPLPCSMSG